MNHFAYFSDIEAAFVRRRGSNLFLSPKDWQLMDEWEKKGIPLFLVIGAIDDAFDTGKPGTLSYCAPIVERKFSDWSAARVGSREPAQQTEIKCGYCGEDYCLKLHREGVYVAG